MGAGQWANPPFYHVGISARNALLLVCTLQKAQVSQANVALEVCGSSDTQDIANENCIQVDHTCPPGCFIASSNNCLPSVQLRPGARSRFVFVEGGYCSPSYGFQLLEVDAVKFWRRALISFVDMSWLGDQGSTTLHRFNCSCPEHCITSQGSCL